MTAALTLAKRGSSNIGKSRPGSNSTGSPDMMGNAEGITPTPEDDVEAAGEEVTAGEEPGWMGGLPPLPTDGADTAAQPSATRINAGHAQRTERRWA